MEYLIENSIERIIVANTPTYIINITDIAEVPEDYFAEDFPERLAQSDKFVFREDKLRSLGVAILLKEVLGLTEKDITIGEFGKPYSEVISEAFSLSHSGDYVVLAVSKCNVGVDIEQIEARHCNVARIVYTDEEISWFQAGENKSDYRSACLNTHTGEYIEDRFMRIWTLKECVSKITGKGLSTDYKSFTVMPLINEGRQEYESLNITGKSVYYPDGYCLSVCVDESEIDE